VKDALAELKKRNRELQIRVSVPLSVLKAARDEINRHVAENGKTLFTDMVLNALEMNIERAE